MLCKVMWILAIVGPATSVCAAQFDFNSGSNEGWQVAGFFDNGGLIPIPGMDQGGSADWTADYSSPESPPDSAPPLGDGSIRMGDIGLVPDSPTGATWLSWDFVTPSLSHDPIWQQPRSFTFDVLGDMISRSGAFNFAQPIWHVLKPDGTEGHFIMVDDNGDAAFFRVNHKVSDTATGSWQTFGAEASNIPGTVLDIHLRVFWEAGWHYNGFIAVDNVLPVIHGDMDADGHVNGLDVDPFVNVLLNGTEEPIARLQADMNSDREVNGLDVDLFVAAVVAGTQFIPEPSTLLLAVLALASAVATSQRWR